MNFAEYELKKYSGLLGININIELKVDVEKFDTSKFFQFNEKYDDAFEIKVKNGTGSITATNERAVLIGVYHFLKKQGCRFLRPGKDGEYIPKIEKAIDVNEIWHAKVRHRGTTSMQLWNKQAGYQSVVDYLDWLPKMAMNTFFNELEDYYDCIKTEFAKNTPYDQGTSLSYESYLKGHNKTIEELKKRHLLYHNAGHGWTIRMMDGIDCLSFDAIDGKCNNTEILAMTNGKRQLFNQKPVNTNLCYSNEKVRSDLAKLVLEYALSHPETDFVHFWLADFYANLCECENCKQKRHSDWYVMILNEIDRVLTEAGSDMKVVFLIYFELMYPPVIERINNPDRFVLMFAPYGRDFSKPYCYWPKKDYEPKLNNDFSIADMNMSLYLKQLSDWQKVFKGDSFAFDYMFFGHTYFDNLCHINYSKIPYTDCKTIKDFGLNGKIECGYIRSFTPTAIAFYTMFAELFYGNTNYDDLCKDYFESMYGKEQKVSEFLESVSSLMPYDFTKNIKNYFTDEEKADIEKIIEKAEAFKEEISNIVTDNEMAKTNYRYFSEFINVLVSYALALKAKSNNESEEVIDMLLKRFNETLFKAEAVMPNYIIPEPMYTYLSWPIKNCEIKEF